MIRTQIYFPEDIHRDLKFIAKRDRTNLSRLLREMAKTVIQKKIGKKTKEPWKEFIGALKYGPKDLSNHVDDIYK